MCGLRGLEMKYPLQVPFEIIKGQNRLVRPMRSYTEKTILEFGVMTEDENLIFDNVCELLEVPEDLPYLMKLAWIYKVREISFGSDLRLTYKCPHCGQITESVILLEDLLSWPVWDALPKELQDLKLKNPDITYGEISEAGFVQSCKLVETLEPKNLHEASQIAIALKAKLPQMRKTIDSKCAICRGVKPINIVNRKFAIDSLSEQSMVSMLQAYNAMAMNGFTKADVDSMLPFERELHLGFFKQRTEESMKAAAGLMK